MSIQLYIYAEAQSDGDQWTPAQSGHVGNPDVRGLQAIFLGREPGYSTDTPIEQIPAHQGLPIDLSPEFRDLAERDLRDFFDWVGWLTLADVIAFDWHKPVRVTNRVGEEYAEWFGDCNQPFPAELDDEPIFSPIVVGSDGSIGRRTLVLVSWLETYTELAGTEFMEAIDRLTASTDDHSRIRLIFWTG